MDIMFFDGFQHNSRDHRAGNYDRANTQRLFWGARFWRWCVRLSERSRQREALSRLDDHDLEDIGVTRHQANVEAAKPFWKN